MCAIFIAYSALASYGQIIEKTFNGLGTASGNFITETNDGGFVLVGTTKNAAVTGSRIYLVRTNSVGDTLWTKILKVTLFDKGISVRMKQELNKR